MRAAVFGGHPGEAWLYGRAWARVGELVPAPERLDLLASDQGLDAVVLLDPGADGVSAMGALREAGKHVLLVGPLARSPEAARTLLLHRGPGRLVVAEPWLHFPPLRKVLELARSKAVGRVTAVRMRSWLGGEGGWDPWLSPDYDGPRQAAPPDVFRECCEKMRVATELLGPIAEVICHAPQREGARAVLVAWHHRDHGRMGVLELTVAPQARLRSAYDPRDDALEATGSAGVLFLTKGQAQLRQAPSVQMFRGEDLHAFNHLDDDWQSAVDEVVRRFVALKGQPDLGPAARAVAAAHAAMTSEGQRVSV